MDRVRRKGSLQALPEPTQNAILWKLLEGIPEPSVEEVNEGMTRLRAQPWFSGLSPDHANAAQERFVFAWLNERSLLPEEFLSLVPGLRSFKLDNWNKEWRPIPAGAEEPMQALQRFLSNPDVEGVLQMLREASDDQPVDLGRYFPNLPGLLKEAGYSQGIGVVVPIERLPSAPMDPKVTVFVEPGPWAADVLRNLEAAPGIQLVRDARDASIVVSGGTSRSLLPGQRWIQVSENTAKYLTVAVLAYLEKNNLLGPGAVVSLYSLVATKSLDRGLLIFA